MHRLVLFLTLAGGCAAEPDFDYAMVQQGTLTVQVGDADGEPVEGAVVGLRMVPADGRWAWVVRSPTARDGEAVLRFTAPLGYTEPTLVTWHPDHVLHRQEVDLDEASLIEVHGIQLERRKDTPENG